MTIPIEPLPVMRSFHSKVLHTVLVLGVIGAIATANLAWAQVSHGGLPYSFIHDVGG